MTTRKRAQMMQEVPPDVGQLHGRMQQIANANRWTETNSPALAAVSALARSESLAPTMQAAAIADAERYAATAGAQLGFSELGMESLRNTLGAETGVAKPMDGLSTASALQHVAKKFAQRLDTSTDGPLTPFVVISRALDKCKAGGDTEEIANDLYEVLKSHGWLTDSEEPSNEMPEDMPGDYVVESAAQRSVVKVAQKFAARLSTKR